MIAAIHHCAPIAKAKQESGPLSGPDRVPHASPAARGTMEGDAQNRGVAVPTLRCVRHDGQTRGHPGVVEPLPDGIPVRDADPALATTLIDAQMDLASSCR
jgi:hypothetical protein